MKFDLEQALAAWRRSFRHQRVFLTEDLDELERHLRDHIAHLCAEGHPPEAAFRTAVRGLGSSWEAEDEYKKVYWGKLKRRGSRLDELIWRTAMLKNYLKITLRQLKRQPLYTTINVLGLAVGMTCCLLIGLYIQDERSYDEFHVQRDRLVVFGNENNFWGRSTITPFPLGRVLRDDLPEVVQTVRTQGGGSLKVVREDTDFRSERRVLLADSAFFELFSFKMLQGDPATALHAPDAAVITEETAALYFGSENPIGRSLVFTRYGGEVYTVTVHGVVENIPDRSTIDFDMVVPIYLLPERFRREDGWGAFMFKTYGLLEEGALLAAVNEKIPSVLQNRIEEREPPAIFAVPLTSLYLSDLYSTSGFRGQMRYLYIFGSIALFVLLIAAINYINLVTAQATQRAREVGVRKTLGALRGQLMRQFLGESVLLSTSALLTALLLTALALPAFNALFEKELVLNLGTYGFALPILALFVLLIGVGAGTYPAFVLSRFQPVRVLRGAGASRSRGSNWLRQTLVVTQFAISVFLIVGTAVIYQQLNYVQHKNLGFQGEQVVQIYLPSGEQVWGLRDDLKQRVAAHAGIVSATTADAAPGGFGIRIGRKPEEWTPQARVELPEGESISFAPATVDVDYVETLGLNLLAGRGFSPDQTSDVDLAYVLNETAVRKLGWTPEEAVGMPFKTEESTPEGRVIGVVEDFHLESLHEEIDPVVLQLRDAESWSGSGLLIARLAPTAIPDAMKHLEQEMRRIAPDDPFEYKFLDDIFDEMYRTEQRLSQIFTSFAVLAILIACLGLFGLAAFTAEQRTKEIGIRKVLGASVPGIVTLLSKNFVKLVAVAFVIAAPLSYFAMHKWLEDFAYRIEISWPIFLIAGLAALFIALMTVSGQAVRAALTDPVEALRYE